MLRVSWVMMAPMVLRTSSGYVKTKLPLLRAGRSSRFVGVGPVVMDLHKRVCLLSPVFLCIMMAKGGTELTLWFGISVVLLNITPRTFVSLST